MADKGGDLEDKQHDSTHRLVHNKNNLENMFLRRRVRAYDRELLHLVRTIEHERLDWMDFAKHVKHCESEDMAEFALIHRSLREQPPSRLDSAAMPTRYKSKVLPLRLKRRRESGASYDERTAAQGQYPVTGRPVSSEGSVTSDQLKSQSSRPTRDVMIPMSPVATDDEKADVITALPDIHVTSHSTRPGLLRKTLSNLDVTQTRPGMPGRARSDLVGSPGHKPHYSTSDIPRTVLEEASHTVIALDCLKEPGQAGNASNQAADDREPRKRNRRRKDSADNKPPLTDRVDNFFGRLDSWLADVKKSTAEKSPLNLISQDLSESRPGGRPTADRQLSQVSEGSKPTLILPSIKT